MPTPTLWRKILIIEEWNEMGAVVADLISGRTFNLDLNKIEEDYLPFHHTAPEGPDSDLDLLIHHSLM